jgi:hypothetical protein
VIEIETVRKGKIMKWESEDKAEGIGDDISEKDIRGWVEKNSEFIKRIVIH